MFALWSIYSYLTATLVSRPAWKINIAPCLFRQSSEQAQVSVSVLELVGREVKQWLSVSTWHLIYSCQSLWELFPGLCSCWWICPVCFLARSGGNQISGFDFLTLFSCGLYTSHHKTAHSARQSSSLGIPRFENSECHVLSQSINLFFRSDWAIFSSFIFTKYRIFQPRDSEFGEVMRAPWMSFALSSVAQLYSEVGLPVRPQSRIQM